MSGSGAKQSQEETILTLLASNHSLQREITALRAELAACRDEGTERGQIKSIRKLEEEIAALREAVRWLDLHRGELPSGMDPAAYPAYVRALEEGR